MIVPVEKCASGEASHTTAEATSSGRATRPNVTHFNGPHADNRDAEESWQNLRLFIDADRHWPS